MTKSYIQIKADIVENALVDKPDSRIFREAWQLEGDVISVDMIKAREIQRNRLRKARVSALEILDAEFMKALEKGEATSSIAAKKQKLRDMPSDKRLMDAETPEELELLTLDYLMNN
ncbi:hypothetical protein [Curvivirga sp.]|uniref:hypothetical protein n=1 Tax=Curvivirga sp. TaxID=2856848 RepID=UPI003B5A6C6C